MVLKSIITFTLVGLIVAQPAQAKGEKLFVVAGLDPRGDNWLALKAGPSLKAARVAKLQPATQLTVIGEHGKWYNVALANGNKGWVSKRYVRPSVSIATANRGAGSAPVSRVIARGPATPATFTYLSCTFIVDGTPDVIDYTLDERAGKVSRLVRHSGFSKTENATFTAADVTFTDRYGTTTINRVNLRISTTIEMINSEKRGQCKIVVPPKRAF